MVNHEIFPALSGCTKVSVVPILVYNMYVYKTSFIFLAANYNRHVYEYEESYTN